MEIVEVNQKELKPKKIYAIVYVDGYIPYNKKDTFDCGESNAIPKLRTGVCQITDVINRCLLLFH